MKTYWKSIKQFILFYSTLNIYIKTCEIYATFLKIHLNFMITIIGNIKKF